MSRVTRHKHVLKEMLADDFGLPKENQQIVRVVRSCGNNLHEVESPQVEEENFLVSMPVKFRKNFWIKRGDCILVDPIPEGGKVKAEICKMLTPEHVKEYVKAGIWPKRFTKKREHEAEDELDDDFMVRNRNRPQQYEEEEETDSEEETDDDDENANDAKEDDEHIVQEHIKEK